jgi:hypothetical protein
VLFLNQEQHFVTHIIAAISVVYTSKQNIPMNMPANRLVPLLATVGIAVVASSAAAAFGEEAFKLLASDGAAGDAFGRSVDVGGNVIVVGSVNDDDKGSVYLFNAATGTQILKLMADDGQAEDHFGFSVAIAGGVVAVGAPGHDAGGVDSGAAYLFDASTGAQLAKLTPDDLDEGDEFGNSIAIDNGIVAVGAWRADEYGDGSGAAYLFDASTGNQIEKLLPDTGNNYQTFGVSIAMDDGVVAIGARTYYVLGDGFTFAKVYLFDVSTGNQLHRLQADVENYNGDQGGHFGDAVDINNGLVAVGAPNRSIFFDFSGAAYVFDASTGEQLHFIFPADGHDRDHFGASIAIDNDVMAIGANEDDDSAWAAGSAYLFDAVSGTQIDKLLASDGAQFDELGSSIAIENNTVVVGAIGVDNNGNDSGATYVFGENNNADDCPADFDGSGIVDVQDLLTLIDGWGGPDSDLNDDSTTDVIDLLIVIEAWGPCV